MGMRKGKRRVVEVAVGRLGGPRALGRFPATHVEEWVPAIVGEDGLGRRRRRRARSIERGREGWAFVGSNPGSTTQTTSRTVHTNGLDEAERARAATAWTRSRRRIRWKWDPPRRRTKRSPRCSLSSPARPGLVGAEPPSRSVLSEGRCERSCRHVAHHPRSSCRPRGSRRPGRRTMCVEASLPIGSTPHPASRETTRVRMRTDSHRRNLAFRTFERSVGGDGRMGVGFECPPFPRTNAPVRGKPRSSASPEPCDRRSTMETASAGDGASSPGVWAEKAGDGRWKDRSRSIERTGSGTRWTRASGRGVGTGAKAADPRSGRKGGKTKHNLGTKPTTMQMRRRRGWTKTEASRRSPSSNARSSRRTRGSGKRRVGAVPARPSHHRKSRATFWAI